MENLLQCIRTRRSCKSFTNQKVKDEVLLTIAEAGSFSPSAMNQQSASILIVKTMSVVEILRKKVTSFMGKDPFHGATALLIVVANKHSHCPIQDGSCVLENMLLAAHACGVGACWINCLHDFFATEEGNQFKKDVLHLSDDEITVGTCALGYPMEMSQEEKPRKKDYIREL